MRSNTDILKLNVGGQTFITTRSTLCVVQDSMLAKMFDCDSNFMGLRQTENGEMFLDRDPTAFLYVLNYLRDGCRLAVDITSKPLLQRLCADADYFGLANLSQQCRIELKALDDKKKKVETAIKSEDSQKQYEYWQTTDFS